jgi:hypothetical protein
MCCIILCIRMIIVLINCYNDLVMLQTEQRGQCTCNVTLRRIQALNVAVEKQCVLHTSIMSVCLYP